MKAGQLNSRITLQQLNAGTDEIGQPINTWQDAGAVWASVRYLNGIESLKADAQSATAKASIRIRYRADITTAMRVLHGATVFQITAVLPDEQRREFTDLVCEATA